MSDKQTEYLSESYDESELFQVQLADGSIGQLSLDHYKAIILVDPVGQMHVALNHDVPSQQFGQALIEVGTDLQARPL